MRMSILDRKTEWENILKTTLQYECDVNNIPGMKEASSIGEHIPRMEAQLHAGLLEVERIKWLNILAIQEAHRLSLMSMGTLAFSCIMDALIILFHIGVL